MTTFEICGKNVLRSLHLLTNEKKCKLKSFKQFWQDFIKYVYKSFSYTLLKKPYSWMTKKLANFGILAKFLVKFAATKVSAMMNQWMFQWKCKTKSSLH